MIRLDDASYAKQLATCTTGVARLGRCGRKDHGFVEGSELVPPQNAVPQRRAPSAVRGTGGPRGWALRERRQSGETSRPEDNIWRHVATRFRPRNGRWPSRIAGLANANNSIHEVRRYIYENTYVGFLLNGNRSSICQNTYAIGVAGGEGARKTRQKATNAKWLICLPTMAGSPKPSC